MHSIDLLLAPRSVVLVGASPVMTRTGGIPVETYLSGGNPAIPFFLVNPKHSDIGGIRCYPSVAELPVAPDLAVLAIRAEEVLPTLQQCHQRGIPAAVIFASGFAEERTPQAEERQRRIEQFARDSGMRLEGPNCLGHANFKSRVFPSFLRKLDAYQPGPVAIVTQSGNMAAVLMRSVHQAGLGMSYMVNTGNEASTGLAEYLEYFAEDPATELVLGYVEQVRDWPRFARAARRLRELGKALFLIKAGSSEKGAEATASHTAAMAGSAAAYAAAFQQLGIGVSSDPARLVDLASLWKLGRRPSRSRVCVVSLSGAVCALMADAFAMEGVSIPSFGLEAQREMRAVIPAYGMVSNPVDLTGQVTNDTHNLGRVLDALVSYDDVDAVVFYVMGHYLDQMAAQLVALAQRTRKLLIVVNTAPAACEQDLRAAGIAVFGDLSRAVASTAAFLRWCVLDAGDAWTPRWREGGETPDHPVILRARADARALLDEAESKQLLAAAGLPVVSERMARTPQEAAQAQADFAGPVAVKVLSPDIPHKSDVGGVVLQVKDADAARAAFETVMANARQRCPQARVEGVVVQPMVTGGQAVLLGATRDPVFGWMLTAGLGGVLTEIYRDVSHRILPVDASMARAMLRELRCHPLLDGFRGAPKVDEQALVELMVSLSDFLEIHGDALAEVELNPVMVLPAPGGVVAVDALVRLLPDHQPG
ncbi:acetate--CoA ligase family protein [Hydrogenophaga sp. BPS33]|uniref:acetate--CoA ligase family protein n=1 Tax=Hydrogenophaga sp. BPS33 TaxID=2651974 RepID=UPI00131FBAD9|nr:acetate--CoA ligase family protein [Hydrogenophaga sp. BPS33]QHE87521.1 acetate--CoA ligase family protein [Hydrogenophaga sp. BPS33]